MKLSSFLCLTALWAFGGGSQSMMAQAPTFPVDTGGWSSHVTTFTPPVANFGDPEAFVFPAESSLTLVALPDLEPTPVMPIPNPLPHDFASSLPKAYKRIDDFQDFLGMGVLGIPDRTPLSPGSALGDVRSIFLFVRDKITTEHQPKAMKGAAVTLAVGSGGMVDKAALLHALLKAGGFEAVYYSATVRIPVVSRSGFDFISWSGRNPHGQLPPTITDAQIAQIAEAETTPAGNALSPVESTIRHMGLDAQVGWAGTTRVVSMTRLWVGVQTAEGEVHLDPSFPTRFFVPGLPVTSAWSSYQRDDLLAAAGGTVINKGLAIHSLNGPAVHDYLEQLARGWQDHFTTASGYHNRPTHDFLSRIVEYNPGISETNSLASLNTWGCPWRIGWTSLPGDVGSQVSNRQGHELGKIPSSLVVSLKLYAGVKGGALTEFAAPLLLPALGGKKLYLEIGSTANSSGVYQGELVLDGSAQRIQKKLWAMWTANIWSCDLKAFLRISTSLWVLLSCLEKDFR